MSYYTVQDNSILIAENEIALSQYYDNVFELPEDYEYRKYIIGEDGKTLIYNPNWVEEKEQMDRERINMLSLTKREVFLALYDDKGVTPEQLRAQIQDPKALIEFDYAEKYYRGNPLINIIGAMLGYTSEDLDYLFEHKEFPSEI